MRYEAREGREYSTKHLSYEITKSSTRHVKRETHKAQDHVRYEVREAREARGHEKQEARGTGEHVRLVI